MGKLWRLSLKAITHFIFYYIGQGPIPEIYFQHMTFLDLAVFPPSGDCHPTHRFIERSDAIHGPWRLIIQSVLPE